MNNPNTASPVTRSAEVEEAVAKLQKYVSLYVDELTETDASNLVGYIAQLEASQPTQSLFKISDLLDECVAALKVNMADNRDNNRADANELLRRIDNFRTGRMS